MYEKDANCGDHVQGQRAFPAAKEEDFKADKSGTETTPEQASLPPDVTNTTHANQENGFFRPLIWLYHALTNMITKERPRLSRMRSSEDTAPRDMPLEEERNTTSSRTSAETFSAFPEHPKFESLEARIRSFSNLPSHLQQRVKPEELANVGFFYTGRSDAVTCFYCGNAHGDWTGNEHPVVEHCRWYPECEHMRKIQGDVPVENIRNAHVDLLKKLERRAATECTDKARERAEKITKGHDYDFYLNAGITWPVLGLAASHVDENSSWEEVLQNLAEIIRLDPQESWGLRSFPGTAHTFAVPMGPDEEGGSSPSSASCLSMTCTADPTTRPLDQPHHSQLPRESRQGSSAQHSSEAIQNADRPLEEAQYKTADPMGPDEQRGSPPSSTSSMTCTADPTTRPPEQPCHSELLRESRQGSSAQHPSEAIQNADHPLEEAQYEIVTVETTDLRKRQVVERQKLRIPVNTETQVPPGSCQPDNSETTEVYPRGGIQHPRYKTLRARQSSFAEFSYPGLGRNFAIAGFHDEGDEDFATCFCCDIKVGRWRASDDPFIKHCIFSEKCPYLRRLAGHCALHYIHVGHPEHLAQLAAKGLAEATSAQRNLLHKLLDELEIADYRRQGVELGLLYLAAGGLHSNATKDDLQRQIRHLTRVKCDSTNVSPCTTPERIERCIRRTVDLRLKEVVDEDICFAGDDIGQIGEAEV